MATGRGESTIGELDDFVGTVAEDDLGPVHAEFGGECVAEMERAAVWVDMAASQRLPHGGDGFRRGAERVFVGGEFDDGFWIKPEFAGDIINGLAWLVRD